MTDLWFPTWACNLSMTVLSLPVREDANTLRPRQNGPHFADDTFKYISLNENVIISVEVSLKLVPKGPINIIPALVQIMAWRRTSDKPLSEPMMVRLPTHICVTRPQWVKHYSFPFDDFHEPLIESLVWFLCGFFSWTHDSKSSVWKGYQTTSFALKPRIQRSGARG